MPCNCNTFFPSKTKNGKALKRGTKQCELQFLESACFAKTMFSNWLHRSTLPCPGQRISKPVFSNNSNEPSNCFALPLGKSVRPTPALNNVSPENNILFFCSKKQTLPAVWPGVNKTFSLKFPKFIVSPLRKKESIFGKKSTEKAFAAVAVLSFFSMNAASLSCIRTFAFPNKKSALKWSAWPCVCRTKETCSGRMPSLPRPESNAPTFDFVPESTKAILSLPFTRKQLQLSLPEIKAKTFGKICWNMQIRKGRKYILNKIVKVIYNEIY